MCGQFLKDLSQRMGKAGTKDGLNLAICFPYICYNFWYLVCFSFGQSIYSLAVLFIVTQLCIPNSRAVMLSNEFKVIYRYMFYIPKVWGGKQQANQECIRKPTNINATQVIVFSVFNKHQGQRVKVSGMSFLFIWQYYTNYFSRHEKRRGRADTDCGNFKEIGHLW